MDCSTPGLPVLHHLPELTQIHVHWVDDAIPPSHPLLSTSPPAFNLSQHQGLFKRVSFSVLGGQSIGELNNPPTTTKKETMNAKWIITKKSNDITRWISWSQVVEEFYLLTIRNPAFLDPDKVLLKKQNHCTIIKKTNTKHTQKSISFLNSKWRLDRGCNYLYCPFFIN